MPEYHKQVYSEYNRDVHAYCRINAAGKLFVAGLASASHWRDLAALLKLDVATDYDVYANKLFR